MAEITLVAEPGRADRHPARRGRLRAAGRIPAVVYGHGVEPLPVSVDGRELRHALSSEPGSTSCSPLQGRRRPATWPWPGSCSATRCATPSIHVDFQIVRRDEVISAEVPIILVGEAKEVEQERRPGRAAADVADRPRHAGRDPEPHRGRHQRADHRRHHPGERPARCPTA